MALSDETSALSDFGRTRRTRFVRFFSMLNWRRLLSADAFMINSMWGLDMMRQAGYAHKTHLVYPACEIGPAHQVKPTRDRGIDVVTIGSISPVKRHHDTLAACASSPLCGNVAIVGRRDSSWYETEISHMSDTVKGAVMYCDASESDKWQIMQNAKCVMAPIRFEHFGIGVVEAINSGCIPIVYGAYGHLETVPYPELHFHNVAEASRILDRALAGEYDHLLPLLQQHAQKFSYAIFKQNVQKLLNLSAGG